MKIIDAVFVYQLKAAEDLMWHGRNHFHKSREAEVTFFTSGSGTITINGKKYRIFDNSLFLNTEDHVHYVVADDLTKPLSYYAILFRLDEDDEELFDIAKMLEKSGPKKMRQDTRILMEQILTKSRLSSDYMKKSAIHQLMQLLYMLPENDVLSAMEGNNTHIVKAQKYFQSHVTERISLEDVARALNLSESYLVRIFQKNLQMSPMKYFNQLKINAAMGFLENTDLSLRQIAGKLGYCSEFHFSKQFKDYTGFPPSHYRKGISSERK